jgi:type II secretory pathway pseudopilin PulG
MKILNKRKGFALTEVLMAIAVIIIVGIAAYPLYTSSRTNADVTQRANEVVALNSYMQELFSQQQDSSALEGTGYASLIDSFNQTTGYDLDDTRTTLRVNSLSYGTGSPRGFVIAFMQSSVPEKDCVGLMQTLAPVFDGMMTGGPSGTNVIKNDNALATADIISSTVTDISPDTISTGCQGYANGGLTMDFYEAN